MTERTTIAASWQSRTDSRFADSVRWIAACLFSVAINAMLLAAVAPSGATESPPLLVAPITIADSPRPQPDPREEPREATRDAEAARRARLEPKSESASTLPPLDLEPTDAEPLDDVTMLPPPSAARSRTIELDRRLPRWIGEPEESDDAGSDASRNGPGAAPDEAPQMLGTLDLERFYPAAARRLSVEGATRVRLEIDATGRVASVTVLDSTPPGAFEGAAVRLAKSLRFTPAKRDGTAVAATLTRRIVWRLER